MGQPQGVVAMVELRLRHSPYCRVCDEAIRRGETTSAVAKVTSIELGRHWRLIYFGGRAAGGRESRLGGTRGGMRGSRVESLDFGPSGLAEVGGRKPANQKRVSRESAVGWRSLAIGPIRGVQSRHSQRPPLHHSRVDECRPEIGPEARADNQTVLEATYRRSCSVNWGTLRHVGVRSTFVWRGRDRDWRWEGGGRASPWCESEAVSETGNDVGAVTECQWVIPPSTR